MSESSANLSAPAMLLPVPRRRRRWVMVLLALLLVVTGGAIGSGLTFLVAVRQMQYRLHHPDEFPRRTAQRMKHALGLSDQQVTNVERVLHSRQLAIQQIRREVQPRLEQELDQLGREVAEQLDAAQAAKWHKLFEQRRRNWLPAPPPPAAGTSQPTP